MLLLNPHRSLLLACIFDPVSCLRVPFFVSLSRSFYPVSFTHTVHTQRLARRQSFRLLVCLSLNLDPGQQHHFDHSNPHSRALIFFRSFQVDPWPSTTYNFSISSRHKANPSKASLLYSSSNPHQPKYNRSNPTVQSSSECSIGKKHINGVHIDTFL